MVLLQTKILIMSFFYIDKIDLLYYKLWQMLLYYSIINVETDCLPLKIVQTKSIN